MALEELKSAIEHATSVQTAAVTLIKDLSDKLANLANNPDAEEIRRLSRELRQRADELADAIAGHEDGDEGEDVIEETRR